FAEQAVVEVERKLDGSAAVSVGDDDFTFDPVSIDQETLLARVGKVVERFQFARRKSGVEVGWQGHGAVFDEAEQRFAGDEAEGASGRVQAPMSGSVVKVLVSVGERVQRQQCLFVLEAMKMELEIRAEIDGVVASLEARGGQQV